MDPLHPQLQEVRREIDEATARAKRLVNQLDDAAFQKRPAGGSWSAAECLVHLNLTTRAFLPLIDDALRSAPPGPVDPGRRYRRDVVGWLLTKMMEPPARMKVKTTPPFMPEASAGRTEILGEFERLQAEFAARVESANRYDISAVKVRSPFSETMRYRLIGGLTAILAHERRHLWQAERASGLKP